MTPSRQPPLVLQSETAGITPLRPLQAPSMEYHCSMAVLVGLGE